jgi:Zn-dependent protease with chaperone function
MIGFTARHYPGDRPLAETVQVAVDPDAGALAISGAGYRQWFPLDEITVEARLGTTPRVIVLPGGGRLESSDHGQIERLDALLGNTGFDLHRLEPRRNVVVAALVAAAGGLALFVTHGIPGLAYVGAWVMPPAYESRLGELSLEVLDRQLLRPTRLAADERRHVRALFAEIAGRVPGERELRLEFRGGGGDEDSPGLGPNALALPGDIVVLTDELVALAESDDELAGVLAHEVGHIVYRHGMRNMIQSVSITVLVGALLGDVAGMSVMVESVPAVLANSAFSRRFEVAADDYAIGCLNDAGRNPRALGDLLRRLEDAVGAPDLGYLSSHPPARKRAKAD